MYQDKLEWQTGASSNYGPYSASSHVVNGRNDNAYWGPSKSAFSFAWWSVDMEDEVLILEVKIYLRISSPGCCADRGASLEVRVGNADPNVNSEAGKRFR